MNPMLATVACSLLVGSPQSADEFRRTAEEFILSLGYSSPTMTQLDPPRHGLWLAIFKVTGGEVLTVVHSDRTEKTILTSETTMNSRLDRARAHRAPTQVLTATQAASVLRSKAAGVWRGLSHEEKFGHGSFTGKHTPDMQGGSRIEGRLLHAGFPCPLVFVRLSIDLESGNFIECSARTKLPNFPAQAPAQWVTRTAAVAAAFPGPPRWHEGDWAELQWFEPSRGATCKLAWALTRGKEKVTVDAVNPAVLKRDIYGSVLQNGG